MSGATDPQVLYLHILSSVDAVTFTINRAYPASTALGASPYQARLRVIVKRPSVEGGLARVIASAELREPAPHAGASTTRATRLKPLPVVEDSAFFCDSADGSFYRSGSVATTIDSILDTVYEKHCRTLRWHFRLRAAVVTSSRTLMDGVIRGGRDVVVRLVRVLSAGGSVLGAPRA